MKFVYLFLLVCLSGQLRSEGPLHLVQKGIDELLQNDTAPDYLQNAIDRILKIASKSERNKSICNTCVTVADALLKLRRSGGLRNDVLQFGQNLCLLFILNKKPFCTKYIDLYIDAALYIIDKKPDLTAEHICAIRLQEYDCNDAEYDSWSINIPPRTVGNKPNKNDGGEELVVHLTDFHYDPIYEPGAKTECDYNICGQNIDGIAVNPERGAGYWGDYSPSDMPLHSIQDVLKQVVKQYSKIDRVYYTGDIVSHQTWSTSKESNSDAIRTIMKELKNSFNSIPLFPILGNHEAHPSDLFSPTNVEDEKLSSQWLFDLVADEWSNFLPNSTQNTIKKGGYYTVLVKPGFRIIGLNSNLCFTYNLWLIYDQKNLQDQLQWLVDNLAAAEENNEFVHIVSHVPPGDTTCLKQWNQEYRRIVDRFSSIITGQFNGHTHLDELKIFYDVKNPNEVINVAFVGGSFTTFVGLNPNYRVYNINSSTWSVNDYDQWIYNLEQANKYPKQAPNWRKLYSFKDAYGLDDLQLPAYHKLLQKMADDISLIEQYRRFKVRNSAVMLNITCGKECLADVFCSISRVDFENSQQCKSFKTKFHNN